MYLKIRNQDRRFKIMPHQEGSQSTLKKMTRHVYMMVVSGSDQYDFIFQ